MISLTDSIDRREAISKYLDILNISFEFVDAIDGRNGLPSEYEEHINRESAIKKGHILADVQYACALSHMKTYRKIVNNKIQWALIMEDDAIPSYELVPYLVGKYYEDAQLTQLYYGLPIYVNRKSKNQIFGKYISYLHSKASSSFSYTVCYIISYNAAQFILENGFPVNSVADWPECVEKFVHNGEFRIVYPQLIYHTGEGRGVGSIIGPYSRKVRKDKKRILGIYIQPINYIIKSYTRAIRKIYAMKIRH